jgi:hypothetical protein
MVVGLSETQLVRENFPDDFERERGAVSDGEESV